MDKVTEGLAELRKSIQLDAETMQATAMALVKLIATFPWLLEVADSGFDRKKRMRFY